VREWTVEREARVLAEASDLDGEALAAYLEREGVSEAQATGVRLAPACRMLGISARTIERWRADPEAGDRRCGPHRRPSNALSPAEEAQVVTVLTSSRYAGLSPKQLVPQLADEGLYLASESTMYRAQRRHGLRTTRLTTARTHVAPASTVHQATGPNQVWSWDITWLPTRCVDPLPLSHHGCMEPSHCRLAHRGTRVGRCRRCAYHPVVLGGQR